MTGRSVIKRNIMPKIVDKTVKRKEIAEKAIALFAQQGFENTPVRQITAHVGIGKGTFYDYFKDKEDILNEIVQLMFAGWAELLVAKISHVTDPLEQLFTLLKEGSKIGDSFQQMMIIYIDIWRWSVSHKGSREFLDNFRSFLTESKQSFAAVIRNAQDAGMLKKEIDPDAMAGTFLALIDGMCMHRMILKDDFDVESATKTFFHALLNGIRP
jgi:AcrR family transcriptional regulator